MDTATKQTELENQLREIEAFKKHPLMKAILDDNREQQEACVALLCDELVTDISSFFAHFAALGHLRGLRRMPCQIDDRLEEIKNEIKENN